MCRSPEWGARSWLLAKEAAVTRGLSEGRVDVDAGWVLVLCARFTLHQRLSMVLIISAWAADTYLLLLGSLVLLRSLESRLLRLGLCHRVHAPVNLLAARGAL